MNGFEFLWSSGFLDNEAFPGTLLSVYKKKTEVFNSPGNNQRGESIIFIILDWPIMDMLGFGYVFIIC